MSASRHPRSAGPGPGPADPLPRLHQTVYCSLASEGVDEHAVARIVEQARAANPGLGITGMLVFGSGIFFQWLEGRHDHVVALMERLRGDPRHDTVVELSQGNEVRERLFPQWDMELVTSDQIREVLADALGSASDDRDIRALRHLLNCLKTGPLSGIQGG